jgi:hypothetical protein
MVFLFEQLMIKLRKYHNGVASNGMLFIPDLMRNDAHTKLGDVWTDISSSLKELQQTMN